MSQKTIQMDEKNSVSVEEIAAEQAQLAEVKEDEVRAGVISEYGFDETVDAERIDKLVAKEIDSRKKLSQAIGQKRKYRDEAKKFADELKSKGTATPSKTGESELSIKDWKALQDVHEDDVESVVKWAKFEGISVAEAKKSDHIKTFLREKDEFRKTALANNTGPAKRSSVKVSDEEIVAQSKNGQVPEDPEVLASARWNLKKKRLEK